MLAIRDNESRCVYLGINTSLVKILLLVAMVVIAAVSGVGYAAFSGAVAPELTGFVFGTELIIWVALGGRGTQALLWERNHHGSAMLVVEQNVPFALKVTDRYLVLKQGEIIDQGEAKDECATSSIFEHLKV